MTELHPTTVKLLDRMTGPPPSHPRFVGERVDLTEIDALALGDLWVVAKSTLHSADHHRPHELAAETARSILERGRDIEPAFRGSACRDYLDLLTRQAEEKADEDDHGFFSTEVRLALARCIDLTFDGLGPAAKRLLAVLDRPARPHLAVALARLARCESEVLEKLAADLSDSPLLVEELRAVADIELSANIAIPDILFPPVYEPTLTAAEACDRLFGDPGYAAFAEVGLKQAAERVRRIHDRELPYAADKAFTRDEGEVVARLTRAALSRDESWLPPVLDELFRKVSLAPTSAKTVPSQSVAIALGHAIEAFPTPEAVATLRAVLRDVRHAGVKKKLQRNLSGAERGLADRPEIALRLPVGQPISKPQLTTLMRCLEAGLASCMALKYEDWRVRLATHDQAKTLAGSLVWRVFDGAGESMSVLPVTEHGRLTLQDVAGAVVAPQPDCRVMLWHPVDATAVERTAWRDRLAAVRLKQPFKQVFREHYAVPADELSKTATAMFSGHVVSVTPFLGVARRERWRLGYDCLERSFGRWMARLDVADHIYPGCGGGTTTGKLSLWTSGGKRAVPVRVSDLPVATVSEILRSVDLLVSTSGFAVTAEDEEPSREMRLRRLALGPIGAMAEMRRQALERALHGLDGMEGLQFDPRHLRLGPYAIHLATGRVTCDGEPIVIDLPKPSNLVAIPWLPYDEKLLETICYTAIEIGRRIKGQR